MVHAPRRMPPARGRRVAGRWWQRFNDPQLTALVTQALQANTDVRSAQAALQQARALRDVQRGRPAARRVGASASAQRSKSGGSAGGQQFPGRLRRQLGARCVRRQAQRPERQPRPTPRPPQASLADVQVSLAAEVARDLHRSCAGCRRGWLIARSNLASQRETLQITRWRAQAGLASSLDVEQARAASEQTGAQIPALETSIAQARQQPGGADRPGARRAAQRAGRPPRPVPQARRRPGAGAFRPKPCASAPMCAPPSTASAPRWRAWRRPTRRATRAFSSAARWACAP